MTNPKDSASEAQGRALRQVEIRLNTDGSLNEVVSPHVHLEQMDTNHWWLAVYGDAGQRVTVGLHARVKITAFVEREGAATPTDAARAQEPQDAGALIDAALTQSAPHPSPSAPVALESVELTRDTAGMCIVKVNGREAIRDNGDVISHYATVRTK